MADPFDIYSLTQPTDTPTEEEFDIYSATAPADEDVEVPFRPGLQPRSTPTIELPSELETIQQQTRDIGEHIKREAGLTAETPRGNYPAKREFLEEEGVIEK